VLTAVDDFMLLPAATAGREPSANALAISATSSLCMAGWVFNGVIPWCVTSVTPGETQRKLGQQPSIRRKLATPYRQEGSRARRDDALVVQRANCR
jgi:hypothetical protein